MNVQGYPVGWAAATGDHPTPYMVYLLDMPGVATQGRTFQEAFQKLEQAAPAVLEVYRREGKVLPAPSAAPGLRIAAITWLKQAPLLPGIESPLELQAELTLAPA